MSVTIRDKKENEKKNKNINEREEISNDIKSSTNINFGLSLKDEFSENKNKYKFNFRNEKRKHTSNKEQIMKSEDVVKFLTERNMKLKGRITLQKQMYKNAYSNFRNKYGNENMFYGKCLIDNYINTISSIALENKKKLKDLNHIKIDEKHNRFGSINKELLEEIGNKRIQNLKNNLKDKSLNIEEDDFTKSEVKKVIRKISYFYKLKDTEKLFDLKEYLLKYFYISVSYVQISEILKIKNITNKSFPNYLVFDQIHKSILYNNIISRQLCLTRLIEENIERREYKLKIEKQKFKIQSTLNEKQQRISPKNEGLNSSEILNKNSNDKNQKLILKNKEDLNINNFESNENFQTPTATSYNNNIFKKEDEFFLFFKEDVLNELELFDISTKRKVLSTKELDLIEFQNFIDQISNFENESVEKKNLGRRNTSSLLIFPSFDPDNTYDDGLRNSFKNSEKSLRNIVRRDSKSNKSIHHELDNLKKPVRIKSNFAKKEIIDRIDIINEEDNFENNKNNINNENMSNYLDSDNKIIEKNESLSSSKYSGDKRNINNFDELLEFNLSSSNSNNSIKNEEVLKSNVNNKSLKLKFNDTKEKRKITTKRNNFNTTKLVFDLSGKKNDNKDIKNVMIKHNKFDDKIEQNLLEGDNTSNSDIYLEVLADIIFDINSFKNYLNNNRHTIYKTRSVKLVKSFFYSRSNIVETANSFYKSLKENTDRICEDKM